MAATTGIVGLVLAGSVGPAMAASVSSSATPFAGVRHVRVFDARVKAHGTAGFAVKGVPVAGVSAVVVGVAVAEASASGSLTAYTYGAKRPGVVSLSLTGGRASTGEVVVVPGSRDRVSVFNGSAGSEKITITVLGYYAAPGTAAAAKSPTTFVPVTPTRLASLAVAKPGFFVAAGKAGVPVDGVAGVVLSVTVVKPTTKGAVTLFPYGSKKPTTSTLAFGTASVTTLAVVQPGGKGRIAVATSSAGAVRVHADVVGYLRTLHTAAAPTSVAVVAHNGSATVTWTASASDGGTPITGYRVVAQPGSVTVVVPATATSALVTGLSNGITYSFAVSALNSRGAGAAGAPVAPVTPLPPPTAPTDVTATLTGIGQVSVSWTAPGGLGPVSYQVTAAPGGATQSLAGTSTAFTGLSSGDYYSFTVTASNAIGASPASAASSPVLVEGTSVASVSTAGAVGDGNSEDSALSADGRFVVFDSEAHNLVPQPTAGQNVFVRDRLTGVTTLVSVASNGSDDGNAGGVDPSISADGRYIAFDSDSSNLTPGDTNGAGDVFVRDQQTGLTRLVSRSVAAPGNHGGGAARISADGSAVVFTSGSTNLLANGTTVGNNVFVATLASGAVSLITPSSGTTGPDGQITDPVISADGHYVAYSSRASNLVSFPPANGHWQVFLADARLGGTRMITAVGINSAGHGESFTAAISDDGRYIAFYSDSDNLAPNSGAFDDAYVADTTAQTVTLVSRGLGNTEGDNSTFAEGLSADGRYLLAQTDASNMVAGAAVLATKVLRFDLQTGARLLLSVNNAGVAADRDSNSAAMSGDGQHIVWSSGSDNLSPVSPAGSVQVFAADLG